MTRVERRRQRQRQIILRVCAGVGALAFLLACVLLLTGGGEAEETEPEPMETAEAVVETTPEPEAIDPLKADKEALARMVWGEARGCSTTEQAAVVWCALNRFDSGDPYYANCVTIYDIVTQPRPVCRLRPGKPGGAGHPGPGGGCAGPMDGREGLRRRCGPRPTCGVPVLHGGWAGQHLPGPVPGRQHLGLEPG